MRQSSNEQLEKRLRDLHRDICPCAVYEIAPRGYCIWKERLVTAARTGAEIEREECARLADEFQGTGDGSTARAIRARGGK